MITLIEDYRGLPKLAFKSRDKAHEKCSEMNENLSPWEMAEMMFHGLRDIKLEDA